jgi:uncharacterized protein (TIGR03435 family)
MKTASLLSVVCVFAIAALAQPQAAKLEFEVASIRPPAPEQGPYKSTGLMRGGPGTSDPGQIRFVNSSLANVVMTAYNLKPYQLTAPDWMSDVHFDIVAKVPDGASSDGVRVMLQNMLAVRFQLKVHMDKKEMQAYSLVVAKGGLKMKPAAAEATGGAPPGASMQMGAKSMHFTVPRATMASICATLSRQLSEPVIDQTGLTGAFNFDLEFAREGAVDATAPGLFTALQEQLGLRLESKKQPVDIVIVDHSERTPTEN